MKVFLSVFLIAFVTKVQSQLPIVQFDMNEFMNQQQQHQHHQQVHMPHMEQPRQNEADEQMVGSPLFGINKFGLGSPFGLHHALGKLGIPGAKLSNFHAGSIGGLKFGNMLLGASNPMADEGEDEFEGKKMLLICQTNNRRRTSVASSPSSPSFPS